MTPLQFPRSTLALAAALLLAGCGLHRLDRPDTATTAATPAAAALGSGVIEANLDRSVRPQDDLFRYINGAWLKANEIPADKTSYGIDGLLDDRNQDWLKALVEQASASGAPGSEARKIGDLYAAYLDEAKLNALGAKPLFPLLTRIDGVDSRKALPALYAELDLLGIDTPVAPYVHPDARDVSRYSLDLYQSGLGLPDRDFYLDGGERFVKLRAAYLAYMTQLFKLTGEKNAAGKAKDVLTFETALAKLHWSKVENRDPVKTYNPRTLKALAKEAPGYDWSAWVAGLGLKTDAVVVSQPSYLQGYAKLAAKTPLATLKAHAKLHAIATSAPYLSQDFYDAHFALRKALSGVQQPQPRWKRGLDVVEDGLGEALGKLYVAEHFPEASKQKVQALVGNLLKAYAQKVDTLEWMSPETKAQAKDKLAKFTVKVGYPDKWRDYSGLEIVAGDLLGNIQRSRRFEARYNLDKLGQPVDRSEWQMTPQTINAYYDPQQNEIVFPAAILQAPYFDASADDAVNYGAIGAVIGHEISHGFDDEGSQFDGDGNLRDWWTKEDRERFEARAKQLAQQFDGYEPVPGLHVNGELTLGENIADLAGIIIAYRAWEISLNGQPAPVIDGHTGAERFFAGYAQSWMTKVREETQVTRLKSDPHSPPDLRVNGVVVNVPAFHQTYGTKPGDGLYKAPEARVAIW
ncbi:M13 family peptidase [Stagnimonas aquatica]|uniref:M13 family peptidase n=1 Tax=Stagnimonas aquatica TaxID=2689987 RepID=A0A3N0VM26_9GAMM|nr:M13 family metallopeptidase [Stagnimonas aquatica]ROH93794.1 M13 family peptidase [Stagnimonas aquatica]